MQVQRGVELMDVPDDVVKMVQEELHKLLPCCGGMGGHYEPVVAGGDPETRMLNIQCVWVPCMCCQDKEQN